ncbi:ABC-type phosphate/phosphonate transport system, substrate-binding protein [Reichenbachiella faecimaris]|uniref:ABC-type phosphate/phosphonate transport system, substrate-binding protein n=1 Tax=Reichenbachiella faecimaris TaxID=692418 RepID=A0A1W2GKR1_REIFA|nr:PhnD/SsuA/transferrin family substrate-binding protein [Reichenbachiella faecimaris]SMD37240.1 ABC-type phosphate/phosphonate transport system, substrate-binding protein [Reichenbachiella faecimaris]
MRRPQSSIRSICVALLILIYPAVSLAQQAPDTLTIGLDKFMPADKFKPIADFLNDQLAVYVEYENFNSLLELSGNQSKYDLIYTNAFGYAYAQVTELPFQSYLVRADKAGTTLTYKSCLIANKNSNIKSTKFIADKSSTIDVSFTYPSSTSGHIIPRIYLTQLIGQSLESGFKSVNFETGHKDVIQKINEGSIALGACSCQWIREEIKANPKLKNTINVLWESIPIPHAVWAANQTSDPAVLEGLDKVLNDMLKVKEIRNIVDLPNLSQYSPAAVDGFNYLINQLKKDDELEFYLYYYESFSE